MAISMNVEISYLADFRFTLVLSFAASFLHSLRRSRRRPASREKAGVGSPPERAVEDQDAAHGWRRPGACFEVGHAEVFDARER
jgi:hypothetical protein